MDIVDELSVIDIKKLEVKARLAIKRLDTEFNYDFYIPPFELREDTKSGIDWNLVNDQNYIESAKLVGKIHEIVVSVCPNDPLKNDLVSPFRIHGRPIDGRTRYLSSKKAGMSWPVKYVKVRDFEQFIWIWSHFNSLKGGNSLDEANKFEQLCVYRNQNGMPKDKISESILKQYGSNHPFNTETLRKRIKKEYKRNFRVKLDVPKPIKSLSGTGAEKPDYQKRIFSKDREISKKEIEINNVRKELFETQDRLKTTEQSLKDLQDILPFLTTPQQVKAENSDVIATVFYDLNNKKVVLKIV